MGVIIFILKKEQAYLTDFLSLAANDLKNKGYERLLLFLLRWEQSDRGISMMG